MRRVRGRGEETDGCKGRAIGQRHTPGTERNEGQWRKWRVEKGRRERKRDEDQGRRNENNLSERPGEKKAKRDK